MSAKIFIHPKAFVRKNKLDQLILEEKLSLNHPDLLFFAEEERLGVEQTKKVKDFLSLKPYSAQNRVVVLESAQNLTIQAQNSLLKLLEESPLNSRIYLGADSEGALLPTIISRCELIFLDDSGGVELLPPRDPDATRIGTRMMMEIDRLFTMTVAERFNYIESLNEKEIFLEELVAYFQEKLRKDLSLLNFTKELLQAEEWAKSSVNIRGILEYLMLILPNKK